MWWNKPNTRFCNLQTGYLMSQKRAELEESTSPLTVVVPVRLAPVYVSICPGLSSRTCDSHHPLSCKSAPSPQPPL